MQSSSAKIEMNLIKGWKIKLALLMAIISPAITATGAYYNLKAEVKQSVSDAQEKIDATYVRKDTLQRVEENLQDVKTDVREIKTLLIRRSN